MMIAAEMPSQIMEKLICLHRLIRFLISIQVYTNTKKIMFIYYNIVLWFALHENIKKAVRNERAPHIIKTIHSNSCISKIFSVKLNEMLEMVRLAVKRKQGGNID